MWNGAGQREFGCFAPLIPDLARTEADEVSPAGLATPRLSTDGQQEFPEWGKAVVGWSPKAQFKVVAGRASGVNAVYGVPNLTVEAAVTVPAA
ncbi:MAG TPA: hypothetical protein VEQ63_00220 [Bryobacteraceae bacterium]|nr:hypothetical protein [Bryobacteraceae bacterium]